MSDTLRLPRILENNFPKSHTAIARMDCTTLDGKLLHSEYISAESKPAAIKKQSKMWRKMKAMHSESYVFTNWMERNWSSV